MTEVDTGDNETTRRTTYSLSVFSESGFLRREGSLRAPFLRREG